MSSGRCCAGKTIFRALQSPPSKSLCVPFHAASHAVRAVRAERNERKPKSSRSVV